MKHKNFKKNNYEGILYLVTYKFIERQKKRSKFFFQEPGARKNLSVIESYTKIQFNVL